MGFISSIFCGSSDKTSQTKNAGTGNNNTTKKINNESAGKSRLKDGSVVSARASSQVKPITTKTTSNSGSGGIGNNTTARTHKTSPVSSNGHLKKHRATDSPVATSSGKQVLRAEAVTPKTSVNGNSSTSDSTPRTNITKDDQHQHQKDEKNITVVTQQLNGDEEFDDDDDEEEDDDDDEEEEDINEKREEYQVKDHMDVDTDESGKTTMGSQDVDMDHAGNASTLDGTHQSQIISQTSSVVAHETQTDSDASTNVNSQQQYTVQDTNLDFMQTNVIDLTKLQKGQAHAKGFKTLLAPKDDSKFLHKKCLVLDLDETLVHSSFKYVRNADFVIPVDIDNQIHNVYVIKRPGVDKFLETVAKIYEVVVFTASVSRYGDPLLDILDNVSANSKHLETIHHRLFRDSCYTYEGNYVKNLSQMGRPLEDIIILDNSPASYIFHPQHAVPISSWFSDTHDNELIDILPILTDLSGVPDVSKILDVSL